jgi:hypothetical protein
LNVFLLVGGQDAKVPSFFEYLFVLADHLAFAMLLILFKSTYELRSVRGRESSLSIFHVVAPLSFVLVSLPHELLSKAVALSRAPIAHVQVTHVVEASAAALSQVFSPHAMIFVVTSLVLICTKEDTLAVSFVLPVPLVSQNLAFVLVTISISQLIKSVNSKHVACTAVAQVLIKQIWMSLGYRLTKCTQVTPTRRRRLPRASRPYVAKIVWIIDLSVLLPCAYSTYWPANLAIAIEAASCPSHRFSPERSHHRVTVDHVLTLVSYTYIAHCLA